MKITLKWLKRHGKCTSTTLIDDLISLSIEVESIEHKNQDIIYNLSIPSNRPDLKNIRGIMRELSFLSKWKKNKKYTLKPLSQFYSQKKSNIKIDNKTFNSFSVFEVSNYKLKPWIQNILNTIDYTSNKFQAFNDFVLWDIGVPIHIYDYLNNIKLEINKENKNLISVNNKYINLLGGEVLVKNNENIVSIGGIIGIQGYSKNTNHVFIEYGTFDPSHITCDITNASKIFKNKQYFFMEYLYYLTSLISNSYIPVISYKKQSIKLHKIFFNPAKFYEKIGLSYSLEYISRALECFDFKCTIVQKPNPKTVTDIFGIDILVPYYRTDIKYDYDIIEEILRIINPKIEFNVKNIPLKNTNIVDDWQEVKTLPFSMQGKVKISNPLSKNYLRDNFLNLLDIATKYASLGYEKAILWEQGYIFIPECKYAVGFLLWGKEKNYQTGVKKYNFFDLKQKIYNYAFKNHLKIDITNTVDNDYITGIEGEGVIMGKLKNTSNLLNEVFYGHIELPQKNNIIKNEIVDENNILSIKSNKIWLEVLKEYPDVKLLDYYKGEYKCAKFIKL